MSKIIASEEKVQEMKSLTHIAFIFEGKPASMPPAVEVRGALAEEGTIGRPALLCGSESLEALLYNRRILTMIIGMHLHI